VSASGPRTCWIIGRRNGVGLEQDAALLAAALGRAGWEVDAYPPRCWKTLLNPRKRADAIIHLERVFPLWKLKRARHFLIPNQERFPLRQVGRLKRVDHILCKSRHAREIFARHHGSVRFIGFDSPDRRLPGQTPDYSRFFHLAGRSTLKNTGLLLELWARHPEWPVLTLVQHPDNAPAEVPPNVRLLSRYLPDGELRDLQNACGIHLCPSLSEGWGHYIVEAMSCQAVTVTTDGPPMNELVQAERGLLIPVHHQEPRHLGWNFHVDPAALETAIVRLIAMDESGKRLLGQAARGWFEENSRRFAGTLPELLAELLQQPQALPAER
jgi:glycosyltransferase involved in cell wall biosynthesis